MTDKPARQQPKQSNIQMGMLAVRDVLLHAIDRGQLPVLVMGAIAFLMVWRMPEDTVGSLAGDLVSRLADGTLLGWTLFGVTAIGWTLQARSQRVMYEREIARIAQERDTLQMRIIEHPLQSSRPGR